jgi:hypothetical protein
VEFLRYTGDESNKRRVMTQLLNEGDSYYQCVVPKKAVVVRDCSGKGQQSVFAECSIFIIPESLGALSFAWPLSYAPCCIQANYFWAWLLLPHIAPSGFQSIRTPAHDHNRPRPWLRVRTGFLFDFRVLELQCSQKLGGWDRG